MVLDVRGMKCGGCSAAVKRMLLQQPGVAGAAVNLLTETAVVQVAVQQGGTEQAPEELAAAAAAHLTSKGFPAQLRSVEAGVADDAAALSQRKQEELKKRCGLEGWEVLSHLCCPAPGLQAPPAVCSAACPPTRLPAAPAAAARATWRLRGAWRWCAARTTWATCCMRWACTSLRTQVGSWCLACRLLVIKERRGLQRMWRKLSTKLSLPVCRVHARPGQPVGERRAGRAGAAGARPPAAGGRSAVPGPVGDLRLGGACGGASCRAPHVVALSECLPAAVGAELQWRPPDSQSVMLCPRLPRSGAPNMNSLIALGASTSFAAGAASAVLPGFVLDPSFLEEPVMLLAFVLLGRSLEARARAAASADLTALARLIPDSTRLVLDPGAAPRAPASATAPAAEEVLVPTATLRAGDVVRVLPGERVPVDGVVLSGTASGGWAGCGGCGGW